MAWYGYLRRLQVTQAEPPPPSLLPPGRLVDVPRRGEMLVREQPATGAPTICCYAIDTALGHVAEQLSSHQEAFEPMS